MMQPSLNQLIQITRTLAHDDDFVRVVLASTQGDAQADTQIAVQFRTEGKAISQSGGTAGNAPILA